VTIPSEHSVDIPTYILKPAHGDPGFGLIYR